VKRGGELRRTASKRRPKNTGPSAEVVDAVLERAQYSCELDGASIGHRRGTDFHVHHRRPRRMGGSQLPDTNLPQNLLILCPSCHETVESQRSVAYEGGWLVQQNADPTRVPVLILAKLKFLTAHGKYSDDPPADSLPERAS
jgi:hypothetical protein